MHHHKLLFKDHAIRAEASGLEIIREIPETVEAVIDPGRISQVIDNLISNAIKYTPHGGSITVRAWTRPGFAAFEVADTGIGSAKPNKPACSPGFSVPALPCARASPASVSGSPSPKHCGRPRGHHRTP
ncbi:ATP-binding protein [Arthrobacter sp. USHLN218]|uniref:ATP-binding protein n=1 Tax=Arthrobacter sp. USHLN218 TaxID=3081232 RepID=UPI003FA5483D